MRKASCHQAYSQGSTSMLVVNMFVCLNEARVALHGVCRAFSKHLCSRTTANVR